MGLISFFKGVGEKVFGKKEETHELKASALLAHVQNIGLPFRKLTIKLKDDSVTLEGETETQDQAEKIALAVGNVEGVGSVENNIEVVTPEPEAQFYEVVKGDTLSKIAKHYYGDAMKYPVIFEANKPMLTHPDKIYPGQVLRIPAL